MPDVLVRLPKADLNIIHETLKYLEGIEPLSLKELLAELKKDVNHTSNLFKALRHQLLSVECFNMKGNEYTYLINKGYTIGIGLDITQAKDGGTALFYNAMEKYDWERIYPDMQSNEHRPNNDDHPDFANGLSDDQIDAILYWTLIGAYYKGKRKPYLYSGTIPTLVKSISNLADEKFEPYQLVALISLTYHSPLLTNGNGLHERLAELLEKKYDGSVLLEIIEASNRDKTLSFQDRLLKEAGLFHGKPEEVQLTCHQSDVLMAVYPGLNFISGPPGPYVIAGLENTYTGNENFPEWILGSSKCVGSKIYFGKNEPQIFDITPDINNLIFTGNGNNEIRVAGEKGERCPLGPTTIIDNGITHYKLYDAGNVIVYAAEGKGAIDFQFTPDDGAELKKYEITTPAISAHTKDSEKHFSVFDLSNAVTATYSKYLNHYYPKVCYQVNGDTYRTVTLMNFRTNQFGCALVQNNAPVSFPDKLTIQPRLLKSGDYVGLQLDSNDSLRLKTVNAHIYDSIGNPIRTIKVAEYSTYPNYCDIDMSSITILEGNQFVVAYRWSAEDAKGLHDIFSIETRICSTEKVINECSYGGDIDYYKNLSYKTVSRGLDFLVVTLGNWYSNDNLVGELRVNWETISKWDGHDILDSLYSAIPLNNGGFAVLMSNSQAHIKELTIFILNKKGQLTNTLHKQTLDSLYAISAVGKEGFLLTTATKGTKTQIGKIHTQIYDGSAWSEVIENEAPLIYSAITTTPYIDDCTFVYLSSAATYVYQNNQLISRLGGNLPFTDSMKPEGETFICETQLTQLPVMLTNTFNPEDKLIEDFYSVNLCEEDNEGYAKVAHKLQENTQSSFWGLRSLFGVFNNSRPQVLNNIALHADAETARKKNTL